MRSTFDDFDEFDDRTVDDFLATRHIIRDRQRQPGKKRGRRHSRKMRAEQWDDVDWDRYVDYDDYNDDEFDSFYDSNTMRYGH